MKAKLKVGDLVKLSRELGFARDDYQKTTWPKARGKIKVIEKLRYGDCLYSVDFKDIYLYHLSYTRNHLELAK